MCLARPAVLAPPLPHNISLCHPFGLQAYAAMAEGTGCLSTLGHAEMKALVELQVIAMFWG